MALEVGEAARQSGISVEAIRSYERLGLVQEAEARVRRREGRL